MVSLKRSVGLIDWRLSLSVFLFTTLFGVLSTCYADEQLRLPAPSTISDEAQAVLNGLPLTPFNDPVERTDEEWAEIRDEIAMKTDQVARDEIERTGARVEEFVIAGVTVRSITPKKISDRNKKTVLLFLHGGAYFLSPGISSLRGATTAAHLGEIKIWVPDYRMPPNDPFPAAVEDVVAVYKVMLEEYGADDIAIFGSSAGGGLVLAMMLSAHEQGLEMPASVGLISPWSDLTNAGDSYTTLEWLDPVLVSYDAALKGPAELYANGQNLKHPWLSPVYAEYGDWFPPTYFVTGTRDLFLSNTVRMHRVLRRANVSVVLDVFEGMWHGFAGVPEKEEATLEMLEFFSEHF